MARRRPRQHKLARSRTAHKRAMRELFGHCRYPPACFDEWPRTCPGASGAMLAAAAETPGAHCPICIPPAVDDQPGEQGERLSSSSCQTVVWLRRLVKKGVHVSLLHARWFDLV